MLLLAQAAKGAKISLTDLTTLPTHIARIQKAGDDHIVCGALSPDGLGIAFSDQQGLHLYQLSPQSEATQPHDTESAQQPHDTEAMDTAAEQPALAVSKARVQQVALGRAGQKLVRLSTPEDLPSFQELQYRPGCAQVMGLTAQGTLVVLDTQTMTVRTVAVCKPLHLSFLQLLSWIVRLWWSSMSVYPPMRLPFCNCLFGNSDCDGASLSVLQIDTPVFLQSLLAS